MAIVLDLSSVDVAYDLFEVNVRIGEIDSCRIEVRYGSRHDENEKKSLGYCTRTNIIERYRDRNEVNRCKQLIFIDADKY